MTCNQMITLLNIYRGTDEMKGGTYDGDIAYLRQRGYIMLVGSHYNCTPLASAWVRDVVLKEPA